ncbi:retrovirus-related pol polyprotein from transposon TNT 1-94 [Tanacetum coccineum]
MIDSQMDDMIKEILELKEQVDSLEQNLSKQIKEKESLLQTFTIFKNESKEKEDKYMENEIDLEKKIKELDNIIFKVGQSAQTVHMLTKPQVFYDNAHKQALGYKNTFYLKKAQRIKPTLYDGIVISDKHVAMPVTDDEETLILEEESRSKILSKDFGKRFVPQQELSAEQAFWYHMSNPSTKSSQTVFDQKEVVVQLSSVDKQYILLTVLNSMSLNGESVNMERKRNESYDKCFNLDAELLKSQNVHNKDKDTTICKLKEIIKSMREKSKEENVNYDYCEIETKNVELENSVAKLLSKNERFCKEINHVKQVFKDQFDSIKKTRVRTKEQCDSLIDKLNLKSAENEDLKAQIQDKVFVITSLKNDLRKVKGKEIVNIAAQIPSANTIVPGMFKLDLDPLAPRLWQNREAHIDYLKYTQEQADILQGIELLVYVRDTCPNTIKLNAKKVVVTPKNNVKKVRFAEPLTSSSNIKHVESSTTSDSNTPVLSPTGLKCSTSNCGSKPTCNKKNDRISQTSSRNMKYKVEAQPRKVNKKNRVVEPICDVDVKHSLLKANSKLICATCKKSMFDGVHDTCLLDFVENVNSHAKSAKKHKKQNIWKPTGHVFTEVGLKWKPIGTFTIVGNSCPLTWITSANVVPPKKTTSHSVETQKPELKVYIRKPKNDKNVGASKKAKIVKSKNANHSEPNHTWGSNATEIPSSSSLVMIGCPADYSLLDSGMAILQGLWGYGDYQLGNVTILRVYYVEGLGHNLLSVGQFCYADLEVAFQKNTCFIRNLEGVDLLSGSRDTNLYTISLDDMLKTSLICLLSKASKTKSWLWHRRLSHLNFGTINKLAKDGLARGIPRLKFQKDHMCSACVLGKSKKSSHQPKADDTNQEKLYLFHMDLCGPMRVASINGKRYILVIVDDYSRFTWVRFFRTKDEAPEAIIKCIKNIQVRLNATIRNVQTDNGTEFGNQTLCEFYENDKKPDLSFFHVFGALCYPTNDNDDVGKLDAKADIGIFVGYAPAKKVFRIYNKRTQKIVETIHVTFDELTAMAFEQFSSRPGLHSMTPATSSLRLIPKTVSQQPCIPPNRDDWDHLFQPMFDEYFTPPSIVVSPVQKVAALRAVDLADSLVSTSIDQDAPSSSTPSTQEQEQSLNISQGFEESPKTPIFCDDPLNESPHEESPSQRSSSNVRQTHTPFEHLGKWTKDHPIANVISDPSRYVSMRKQL